MPPVTRKQSKAEETPTKSTPIKEDDVPQSPPKSHLSLVRRLTIADYITLCNAGSGISAIFLCLNYVEHDRPLYVQSAFVFLFMALFFDIADGSVARMVGSSIYGADLDSLSDVISFGVAPAVLGFTLGLRGFFDCCVLIYFVWCGVARLARFNATITLLTDKSKGKVKYFEGTPIPTSLIIVLMWSVMFFYDKTGDLNVVGGKHHYAIGDFHPLVLVYFISGTLMISETIHIPKP